MNELEISKLIRIKILDPPADTIAQSVEHRRDKPWTWVQILVSVRLFIFFRCIPSSLLPLRSVGCPILTWVC